MSTDLGQYLFDTLNATNRVLSEGFAMNREYDQQQADCDPAFMTAKQLDAKKVADEEDARRVETKQQEIMTNAVYVVDYLHEYGFDLDEATKIYRHLMEKSKESAGTLLDKRQAD